MENIAPIKERALQVAELYNLSINAFAKKISCSTGNFNKKALKSELGGTQICEILNVFDEISPSWLVSGKGEMLIKNDEISQNSDKNERISELKRHIDTLTEEVEMQKDYINTLKDQIRELKQAVESLPVAAEIRKQYK